MKKLFVWGCMILGFTSVQAQVLTTVRDTVAQDPASTDLLMTKALGFSQFIPNKLGIGVGIGTTGVTVDLSTHFSDFIGLRAGVNWVPKVKVSADLDLKTEDSNKKISTMTSEINDLNTQLTNAGLATVDLSQFPGGNLPNKMSVEGKLNNTTYHVLLDVYPFGPVNSFHITAGAYFGPSDIISVYNKEDGFLKPITAYNEAIRYAQGKLATDNVRKVVDQYGMKMIGAELGDYFITPDPADNGNVEATIEVNKFRPYLGLGFGRAVPRNRIGCQIDLGVQFWGSPKVYAPTYNKTTGTYQREQLTEEKAGSDAGGVLKTVSKITVYPTLTIRLTGRIL